MATDRWRIQPSDPREAEAPVELQQVYSYAKVLAVWLKQPVGGATSQEGVLRWPNVEVLTSGEDTQH